MKKKDFFPVPFRLGGFLGVLLTPLNATGDRMQRACKGTSVGNMTFWDVWPTRNTISKVGVMSLGGQNVRTRVKNIKLGIS